MTGFWPDGLELEDTASPREILDEARDDWERSSGGKFTLLFQDAESETGNRLTKVHAKFKPAGRTAEIFTVVQRPDKPYPAKIELTDRGLPNILRRKYFVPGEDDDDLDDPRGHWVRNDRVADSPAEFRAELRAALTLDETKGEIVSLAASGLSEDGSAKRRRKPAKAPATTG